MKIYKNTWHYRLWHWTHLFCYNQKEECIPTTTSLCAYVRWLLIVPLLTGLLFTVYGACITVVNAVSILSGWGYAPLTDRQRENLIKPFAPIPRFLIWLAAVATILWRYPAQVIAFGYFWTTPDGHTMLFILGLFASIVAAGLLVGKAGATIVAMGRGETAKLVAAYFKAKKDRVCPLVSFEA